MDFQQAIECAKDVPWLARNEIEKTPHPTDARAQLISLTPAGRAHLQANRERLAAMVRDRLATHSEADIATAIAVLKSITEKGNS